MLQAGINKSTASIMLPRRRIFDRSEESPNILNVQCDMGTRNGACDNICLVTCLFVFSCLLWSPWPTLAAIDVPSSSATSTLIGNSLGGAFHAFHRVLQLSSAHQKRHHACPSLPCASSASGCKAHFQEQLTIGAAQTKAGSRIHLRHTSTAEPSKHLYLRFITSFLFALRSRHSPLTPPNNTIDPDRHHERAQVTEVWALNTLRSRPRDIGTRLTLPPIRRKYPQFQQNEIFGLQDAFRKLDVDDKGYLDEATAIKATQQSERQPYDVVRAALRQVELDSSRRVELDDYVDVSRAKACRRQAVMADEFATSSFPKFAMELLHLLPPRALQLAMELRHQVTNHGQVWVEEAAPPLEAGSR